LLARSSFRLHLTFLADLYTLIARLYALDYSPASTLVVTSRVSDASPIPDATAESYDSIMSAQELRAALDAPDDDECCRVLHAHILEGITTSSALPATAKAFLEAFIDGRIPCIRRRWYGFALARMINASTQVRSCLQDELTQVGTVILHPGEAEEMRIVAGLIVQAGLLGGIKFSKFWSADKVNGTGELFARGEDGRWMAQFQQYLDVLMGLKIMSSTTEATILYPMAFVAQDKYCWSESDENTTAILIIEHEALTIFVPDPRLHKIETIDVSITKTRSVDCTPSHLHDSQGKKVQNNPWDVVLTFEPNISSYRLNGSQHYGSFKIVMEKKEDAEECANCIREVFCSKSKEVHGDKLPDVGFALQDAGYRNDNRTHCERKISKGGVVELSTRAGDSNGDCSQLERTQRLVVAPEHLIIGSDTSPAADSETIDDQKIDNHDVGKKEALNEREGVDTTGRKDGVLGKDKSPVYSGGNLLGLHPPRSDHDIPPDSLEIKPTSSKRPGRGQQNGLASQKSSEPSRVPKRTGIRSKTRVIDTEEDSISLSSHTSQGSKHCLKAPKMSKILKPAERHTTKMPQLPLDVFDIPQEEGNVLQIGKKRKRGKLITYTGNDTDADEDSDSDYVQSKKRKKITKSPRARVAKNAPTKRNKVSSRKCATEKKTSKPFKYDIKLVSSPKGPLLSKLGAESKTSINQDLKAHNEQTSNRTTMCVGGTEKKLNSQANVSQSKFDSEISILTRLNNIDDHKPTKILYTGFNQGDDVFAQETYLPSSPPSTPHRQNPTEDCVGVEDYSIRSTQTIAPPKVLEDPSSPCVRKTSPHLGTSMRAPAKLAIMHASQKTALEEMEPSINSRRSLEERFTPIHYSLKGGQEDALGNLDILSSNRKPTPAHPQAPSTAISGHADQDRITVEQEVGRWNFEKSDPFRVGRSTVNNFTQKLTGSKVANQIEQTLDGSNQQNLISQGLLIEIEDIMRTPSNKNESEIPTTPKHMRIMKDDPMDLPKSAKEPIQETVQVVSIQPGNKVFVSPLDIVQKERVVQTKTKKHNHTVITPAAAADVELEGETLMDQNDLRFHATEAIPAQQRSSPPPMDYSQSSHSSTSAEPEPRTDSPTPSLEAEEMEWEASLLPHQRNLQDQLLRVSKRVVRHIVDSETAVVDITDTYAADGQHMLRTLVGNHTKDLEAMQEDVQKRRRRVKTASQRFLSSLKAEQDKVRTL